MTLATHAIVGAATAQLFPNHPIIAFCAGFCSHFVLDAIPHWDYKILSAYANPDIAMAQNEAIPGSSRWIGMDPNFFKDLLRTGTDALIGLSVVALLFYLGIFFSPLIIALGAVAAMLPDFLQLVYNRLPYQPLTLLQVFHHAIHAESRPFEGKAFLGIITQGAVIFIVLSFVYYLLY